MTRGLRRLVLLRHGRTAWNLEGRIQGQLDVPLDDLGLVQAEKVAPVIAAMQPAFVRSSDLVRASATAEQVARAAGLELVTDRRFREFDLGERSGQTHAEWAADSADEFAAFRSGRYEVAAGGESREQLVARFVPALEEAFADVPVDGVGVVVAHGAALKVSICAWLGWPTETVLGLRALGNCHWAVLETEIDADGAEIRRLGAFNVQS